MRTPTRSTRSSSRALPFSILPTSPARTQRRQARLGQGDSRLNRLLAQPWMDLSDDALWDLMMGPNIPRAWHVWSDGYCPSCRQDVRMAAWVGPLETPVKLLCPKCGSYFRNDFEKFHRSVSTAASFNRMALTARCYSIRTTPTRPTRFICLAWMTATGTSPTAIAGASSATTLSSVSGRNWSTRELSILARHMP